jgi:hypothetical protein
MENFMTARLTSAVRANALIRKTQAEGGFAVILAKGDETSGGLLLILLEKSRFCGLYERLLDPKGHYQLSPVGPQDVEDGDAIQHYLLSRRRNDPDLWLIELDIASPAQFIAQLVDFG